MSFWKSYNSSEEDRNFEVASRQGYLFKSFVTIHPLLRKQRQEDHKFILGYIVSKISKSNNNKQLEGCL
jgi:hypothetical protein